MGARAQRLKSENSRLRAINRQRGLDMIAAASAFERVAKKLRAKTTSGRRHSELLAHASQCRTMAGRLRFEGAFDTARSEEKLAEHFTILAHGYKAESDKGSPYQQPAKPEQQDANKKKKEP
eukprot:5466135-Pyramimonas_sp.AAC.1